MNKYCTFYIVRHGESEGNAKELVNGHTDSPLSAGGREQVKKLNQILKKIKFNHVFSSDLLRAYHTAEILTLERNIPIKTSQLLREQFYGKYEGYEVKKFKEELKHMIEKRNSLDQDEWKKFRLAESIESAEEMISRFTTFLKKIAAAYPRKKILVATHGSLMRSFLAHISFGTMRELGSGSIKNTGYFVVESDGADFLIKETHGVEKLAYFPQRK